MQKLEAGVEAGLLKTKWCSKGNSKNMTNLWVVRQLVDSLLNETAAVFVLADCHQIVVAAQELDEEAPRVNRHQLDNLLEDMDGALVGAQREEVQVADLVDQFSGR